MVITDAGLPAPVLAVLEAVQFRTPSSARLRALGDDAWDPLLDWCDRRQISFVLNSVCGHELPDRARQRLEASELRYALRFARLRAQLLRIIEALDDAQVPFVVLKGMTHSPELTPEPLLRAQGDIDLWIPRDAIGRGADTLRRAGYVDHGQATGRHLAPLELPNNWRWRGDIFDPEMPVRVELHHDLWSSEAEYISLPGEERFCERFETRDFGGRAAQVLGAHDILGFAALHLLLHLLHGDLPLQRAWEIARFLDVRAADDAFWQRWEQVHGPELRAAESVVFLIATAWFGCEVPESVRREAAALPGDVRRWVDRCVFSPLTQQSRPNKDELWLHLALVKSRRDRARILLRRLAPVRASRKRTFSASRLRHHFATLLPTLADGLLWLRPGGAKH
jgi:hypothetical protein